MPLLVSHLSRKDLSETPLKFQNLTSKEEVPIKKGEKRDEVLHLVLDFEGRAETHNIYFKRYCYGENRYLTQPVFGATEITIPDHLKGFTIQKGDFDRNGLQDAMLTSPHLEGAIVLLNKRSMIFSADENEPKCDGIAQN